MVNKGIIFNILKRDLLYSISEGYGKYLVLIIYITFISITNCLLIRNNNGNIVDLFFYNFRDNGYLTHLNNTINIPWNWLMINALVVFIINDFTYQNLKSRSIYILTRTKRYREFWVSQLCWLFVNILILYILLFVITYTIGFIFLNGTMEWSSFGENPIANLLERDISPKMFIFTMFNLYLWSSITLGLIQTNLNMLIKPNYSILIVIVLMSSSIYLDDIFLPGIHSMILKHDFFNNLYNLTIMKSMLYNVFAITILSLSGYFLIKRKEIL